MGHLTWRSIAPNMWRRKYRIRRRRKLPSPDKRSKGKYEMRPAVKKVYQLRPKVTASSESVASRDCKGIVSVASRLVNYKHDELRPAVSKELYQLCPKLPASCMLLVSRVVNRTRMSCNERYGYSKCPTD
jgi:hypothetical protein